MLDTLQSKFHIPHLSFLLSYFDISLHKFQISATDADISTAFREVGYTIMEGNTAQSFRLDEITGHLSTNVSFSKMGEMRFDLLVMATDGRILDYLLR